MNGDDAHDFLAVPSAGSVPLSVVSVVVAVLLMIAALMLCLLHARHYEVCRKPKFLVPGLRTDARAARSLRPNGGPHIGE